MKMFEIVLILILTYGLIKLVDKLPGSSSFFKRALLLIVLFVNGVCLVAQEADPCSILSITEDTQSKVYYKKSAIPASVKKIIETREKFGCPFRISNPHQRYRSNDVTNTSLLPNNRLVFLIKNGNSYVIVFEHGGRGKCTYCAIVDTANKSMTYRIIPKNVVSSYNDFVSYLRNHCTKE